MSTTSDERREAGRSHRQDRAAYVVRGITEILTVRPELRGVVPAAELLEENLRWSA